MNSSVKLRVVYEVILGKDGYAGTLIDAKVTRIREGKLRIRRGRILFEVAARYAPAPAAMKLRTGTPKSVKVESESVVIYLASVAEDCVD